MVNAGGIEFGGEREREIKRAIYSVYPFVFLPKSYVEILTLNTVVLRSKFFGR